MTNHKNYFANGKPIAHLAYIAGDTRLGNQRISVALDAYPAFLLVRHRSRNESLIAIPWTNIGDIELKLVEKSYAGKVLADILSPISWFRSTEISSWDEFGLTLNYWDEEVQRDQVPTFAIGSNPRRFATLEHTILSLRDNFIAPLGPNSRPNRR